MIVVDGHHKIVTGKMGTLTGRENRRGTNWALIVADRTRNYAGKGRNLESPKKVTNALSSVQKNNLLVCFSAHTKGNIKNRIRKAGDAWCLGGSETRIIEVGNIYPSGGEAGKVHDPRGIFSTVKPVSYTHLTLPTNREV